MYMEQKKVPLVISVRRPKPIRFQISLGGSGHIIQIRNTANNSAQILVASSYIYQSLKSTTQFNNLLYFKYKYHWNNYDSVQINHSGV